MSNNAMPFPIDAELTPIAVAYKNTKMIADEVFPRVPVGKKEFKYQIWKPEDNFTLPNTLVGRKSAVTQVEFGFTEATAGVEDHGLDELVPIDDIDNAPENYNPVERAVASLADLIELRREKRCADLVFNANNYAANNKATLTGAGQYSNDDSDPIKDILTRLDACYMRPNIMVIGQRAWTVLRTHPKIVSATNKNSGESGVAARQAVAELFELDKVLVGESRVNIAKKGQPLNNATVWGNHIALIYQDALADTRGRVTFGFTAQYKNREAGQIPDTNIGLRGGVKVRVGESVRELITAPDLGYLISGVI